MKGRSLSELQQALVDGRLTRREFIIRAAALGLSISTIGSVLAACGGGGGETAGGQAAGATATTGTGAAEGESGKTTLTVFSSLGKETNQMQKSADAYMEMNPDINVRLLTPPESSTDFLGQLLQFFEGQSAEIDVTNIDVIWPGDLSTHLVDLYEYGAQDIVDQHFAAIIENNTVDGRLVGMPSFTDAGLLYYRTDLLEQYGFDAPPETWDELEEMAQTIQEGERANNPDFWGFVWQGNAYEGLTCDALEWVSSHGGGSIVNRDELITINNPQAAAALARAAGWIETISPPGVTGFKEEESRGVWQAGNAAFMRNWPYAYSLGNTDDSPIKGKFDVKPLPHVEGESSAAALGGWQFAVSKYSNNVEQAADLAFFLTSESQQKRIAIEQSLAPTIKSLYEDQEVLDAQPLFERLSPVLESAVARPSTVTAPKYGETSRIFYTGTYEVLTGERDAESAVAEMELDLQDTLGFDTGEPA